MKEEIKYVAFNGAVFDHPEDAEHYEIMARLQAKQRQLRELVSRLMRTKNELTTKIAYYEKELNIINDKFRTLDLSNDTEQVRLSIDRIRFINDLNIAKGYLKTIKPLLIKQNQEYCKTLCDIKRYEEIHKKIIGGRNKNNK